MERSFLPTQMIQTSFPRTLCSLHCTLETRARSFVQLLHNQVESSNRADRSQQSTTRVNLRWSRLEFPPDLTDLPRADWLIGLTERKRDEERRRERERESEWEAKPWKIAWRNFAASLTDEYVSRSSLRSIRRSSLKQRLKLSRPDNGGRQDHVGLCNGGGCLRAPASFIGRVLRCVCVCVSSW